MTKYTKDILEEAVINSVSFAGVLRYIGLRLAGGNQTYITKLIKEFNIDTSHFTGQAWNKGNISKQRRSANEILIHDPSVERRGRSKNLTRSLIEIGREYKCEGCGCDGNWLNGKISLHVDHIDGDWTNHLPSNLRFLCPNCHQQTDTYGAKRLKLPEIDNFCIDCGCKVSKNAKRCPKCANSKPKQHSKKFEVSKEELERLIISLPMTKIGDMFGVSDNAIRKRCVSLGIDFKLLKNLGRVMAD